jgi:hypothetical protein
MPAKSSSDATCTREPLGRCGVVHASKVIQPAKESDLDWAAAVYESLEVVALVLHPRLWVCGLPVLEERQPRLQSVWLEAGRGEKIEVFRDAMAQTEGECRTAIEDEVGRDRIELGPEQALRFGQDV